MRPFKKILLKDVAYKKIKKKVLYENVKHMSENGLVKELNMSRTPIREALFRLQHEGFLEIVSNQGIMVNDLSAKKLNDLIDMRIAIETFSVRHAIEAINESDFEQLEKLIEEQEIFYKEMDIYSFRKSDGKFHYHLLDITDNYYFMKMYSEVYELQFTAQRKNPTKEYICELISDHKKILAGLREGNVEKTIKILTEHIIKGK